MAGPLDGFKVLDFTRVVSGPWCTLLLCDMGAEVLKVEEPGKGDISRAYGPPFIEGESTYFMGYNRGKKSIALNLKHPRGLELMRDLVSKVDILVHNYQLGWVRDIGLDYESMKALNPSLIYCWISAYGEDGPYSEKATEDLAIMGLSGVMSITGQPDGPPIRSHISFSDFLAGYNGLVGILAALRVRDRTGEGQQVSVNLLDSALAVVGSLAYGYMATGEPPSRIAPDTHPSLSPSGTYPTADGYINVGASRENVFPKLCQALGMEEMATDPEFATNPDRVRNRKRLREIIESALTTKPSSEWLTILNEHGVLAEPINDIKQALAHPQVVNNEMKQTLTHPKTGAINVLRSPVELPNTPLSIQGPPPLLGEHTQEVLSRYLSITEDEYGNMHRDGVV